VQNKEAILLRYHEIALKGDNRGWFEDKLASNVRKLVSRALGQDESVEVHQQHGRMILEANWNKETQTALSRVFGLSSFSPMKRVPTDREAIQNAILAEAENYIKKHGFPESFRVKTRRSEKAWPETSPQIDTFLGGPVKDKYPLLRVDLKNPQLLIGLELRFKESYIWTEKFSAEGGLPVGSNAPLLALMSGGLDSPVAAIQVLRRGSSCSFIHFYGTPFVGPEALEKVQDLVRIVNRYQADPQPLHVIPFGKTQEKIALQVSPRFRTILYRRMMLRIANRVAQKLKLNALVTGESLGQVASQTVENLATINSVSKLPVFRPLIGFNKDEIIEKAHRWGTFDIAIRPAVDCCTLFSDRHPILRSTETLVEEEESKFSVQELEEEAFAGMEIHPAF
jgi:tRNA uracil 4-sulfurtransferase